MSYCPANSSLIEINSIRNYPADSRSRVSPFPYFGQYHIFRGNSLAGGLFNCKDNKNISYFCYADYGVIAPDNFRGITALDRTDLIKFALYYDYILLLGNESEDYIRSKITPALFTLIQKDDFIYLFQNNRTRGAAGISDSQISLNDNN
jgi:hypothetical protein